MNDDFNTAVVMAHLNEELRAINSECSNISRGSGDKNKLKIRIEAFKLMGGLLGLLSSSPKKIKQEIFDTKKIELKLDVEKINYLIGDRNQARKDKNWSRADDCREQLEQMGVVLEDTPQGTQWKIK